MGALREIFMYEKNNEQKSETGACMKPVNMTQLVHWDRKLSFTVS